MSDSSDEDVTGSHPTEETEPSAKNEPLSPENAWCWWDEQPKKSLWTEEFQSNEIPQQTYPDVKKCDTCRMFPILLHCIDCSLDICQECFSQHVIDPDTRGHQLFPPNPICDDHMGFRCKMFCKNCKTPVCPECLAGGLHEKHDVRIIKLFRDTPEVIRTISSDYPCVSHIACISEEEFWIAGNCRKVKRFNVNGSLQETVLTFRNGQPLGMTVSKRGHLVYADGDSGLVTLVKDGQFDHIVIPDNWDPNGVCFTSNGDLLVSMRNFPIPSRVVLYSGLTQKKIYHYDKENKPLFSNGYLQIDQNRNGDLCVSDINAKEVVVVNETGQLRFRYTGISSPCGIATDSKGNILIADYDEQSIHIIDQDGCFVYCIDESKLLGSPYALCLDKNDTLFVGTHSNGSVKVIKYLR